MDEESGLERKVEKDVKNTFQELGNIPKKTTKIIKLLNSKSNEELSKKGIKNRTNMVMDIENVFTKRSRIQQTCNKLIPLQSNVEYLSILYKKIIEKGLPECWDKNGNLFSLQNYHKFLIKAKEDTNKYRGITGMLKGPIIVDLLDEDFLLLWQLRNLFVITPTYERYTEVDISYNKMMNLKYPKK